MEKEIEVINTFQELQLSPELLQAVAAIGYTSPTAIQAQAIPVVLQGKDVIGSAQTGTGKTAAFVLPILQMIQPKQGIQALVLTPTRELALQIEGCIHGLTTASPLRSAVVYGGVGIQGQEEKLRDGVEFLVATPGRLLDHIWRGNLDFPTLRILVLDEADRMLDMGFMPDIKKIIQEFLPRQRQTLLFSATVSPEINRLARFALHEPVTIQVGRVKPAEGVTHGVFHVRQEQKYATLVRLLRDLKPEDPVIVFTRSKIGAERLSTALHRSGFDVTALHSDRNQTQRERALLGFRDRRYQVMVATDVASRGLDIEGVALIVNYDVPVFAEDYVHRVGRTARAHAKGAAYTLATPSEDRQLQSIERFIGQPLPRPVLPGGIPAPEVRRGSGRHSPRPQEARRHEQAGVAPAAPTLPDRPAPVPAPAQAESPAPERAPVPPERTAPVAAPVVRHAAEHKRPASAGGPPPAGELPSNRPAVQAGQARKVQHPGPAAQQKAGGRSDDRQRPKKKQQAGPAEAAAGPLPRSKKRAEHPQEVPARERGYDKSPIVTYRDRVDPNRRRWQQSPNPIIEDAHGSNNW